MRLFLSGLFALSLTSLLLITQRIAFIDDAYISYRYVYNLIHHGQLVFNLGARVEGATNLLWMLLLAAATAATGLKTEVLALGLSLGLFVLTVARTTALARQMSGYHGIAWLIVGTIFLKADIFLTATNGLEAALYMALLTEVFAALRSDRSLVLGTGLGLLFMTRPEGFFVGLILALAHGMRHRGWRARGRVVLPWFGIVGAVTLFRLAYYGSPVPNSVIAKSFPLSLLPSVLAEHSWPYLRDFGRQDTVLALIALGMALAFVVMVCRRKAMVFEVFDPARQQDPFGLALPCATAILVLSFAVAARNGGDWMEHFRLLTQYAPVYALGLAALVRTYPSGRAVLAIITLWSLAALPTQACCGLRIDLAPPGDFFALVSNRLAGIVRADDVVSAEAAGWLPYRLIETQIHDPTGLMDPYIAKHGTPAIPYGKTAIDYTFDAVRPSVMIWHWAGHIAAVPEALSSRYTGFCWRFCEDRDRAMVVLVRTDRLDAALSRAFADFAPWPPKP